MIPADRFWSKVDFTDTCWLWTASCSKSGYGKFWLDGQTRRAHRISYIWSRGKILDSLVLDHLCRVRRCVNPSHLEAVTILENLQRGNSDWEKYLTHCSRNHEYTFENTYIYKGKRHCKECRRMRDKQRYWKGRV